MKKISVLFALLLSVQMVVAQKAAVQSAINYLRYDDLDKAKAAIDGASTNEGSMGMSKTWYYKGCIYQAIYESKNEKFAALKPGSIDEARKAFEKANELDAKDKEYTEDIQKRMGSLTVGIMNEGVELFKAKKYSESLTAFETGISLKKKFYNETDTLAMSNAALAADRSGNAPLAISYYKQLSEMSYGGSKTYMILSSLYFDAKDTNNTLKTLNEGRTKFPEDKDLITKQLNLYLLTGRTNEAFAQIDEAIKKDPANATLYFNKAVLADQLKKTADAEAAYKKALEIKPDYFDANYNLGAMYYNQAAEMANKANDIPASKAAAYDAAKKQFDAKFKESQPYLEKAHDLNPTDMATLQSLKTLYVRIGDTKKAEAIKAAMDANKK